MELIYNQDSFDYAKKLIEAGEFESFDSNWKEESPTPDEINHYLNTHSLEEYGMWFLGRDYTPGITKESYRYPYGDLKTVQRSALIFTLDQATKNNHKEIRDAAQRLIDMIDKQTK